jgi:hypothetical protein
MGHFIAAILGKLFADEIKAWLPSIAERVTKVAARRLPEGQRERYDEEWRSHLDEVPGAFAKVWVACGFLTTATQMPSRIGATALYVFFLPAIALLKIVSTLSERNMYTFPLTLVSGDRICDLNADERFRLNLVKMGYASDERVRLEIWVKSREIPLARLLHESLKAKSQLSRIYWKETHYAFWRASILYSLTERARVLRLNHLLLLSSVMSGQMELQGWFERLFAREGSADKVVRIALRTGEGRSNEIDVARSKDGEKDVQRQNPRP